MAMMNLARLRFWIIISCPYLSVPLPYLFRYVSIYESEASHVQLKVLAQNYSNATSVYPRYPRIDATWESFSLTPLVSILLRMYVPVYGIIVC